MRHAIGVAQCAGPTGPCQPSSLVPWLGSNAQGSGPGEESLFYDGSRWWMFYAPFAVNYQSVTPRPVALARLTFGPNGPTVVAPGTTQWADADPATQAATVGATRRTNGGHSQSLCSGSESQMSCQALRQPAR